MSMNCLGLARKTVPNLSRSVLGPPACISSIPQQARAKSIYHIDDFRVQFNTSSTVVKRTFSGRAL